MEEQQGGGPGKEYWFSQDGLGNIATVTKHSGQAAHDYFYDPYGNIIDNNGRPEDSSNWTDPHNHYLLNGKEWDEEMRLHYFGARYYDSTTGIWLTQDIYRGEPRQPMTLHRTLYVLANPVNYVDAYGYMAEIIPNGYGGVGGGYTPVRTYDPTPPNATNPANDPFHLDLPGPDAAHFHDYWGDAVTSHEPAHDPHANSLWSCTAGGFCLVDEPYGPNPQLEVSCPITYLTGGYDSPTQCYQFPSLSSQEYFFLTDQLHNYGFDPIEYLGDETDWRYLGLETNLTGIREMYNNAPDRYRQQSDFDSFLIGYTMYSIYSAKPDLAFDHFVMANTSRGSTTGMQEEPQSVPIAKAHAEFVLNEHWTPWGDDQLIAARDKAIVDGDMDLAVELSVMLGVGVESAPGQPGTPRGGVPIGTQFESLMDILANWWEDLLTRDR